MKPLTKDEHMYRLELTLTGLPKTTNGHNRAHWTSLHKEASKWKRAVLIAVNNAGYDGYAPLKKAKLTLIRCSSACPDSDGLVSSFKHPIDGLVEAGVLENDKFDNIGMPTYEWVKAPPKKGFIKIIVEGVA